MSSGTVVQIGSVFWLFLAGEHSHDYLNCGPFLCCSTLLYEFNTLGVTSEIMITNLGIPSHKYLAQLLVRYTVRQCQESKVIFEERSISHNDYVKRVPITL